MLCIFKRPLKDRGYVPKMKHPDDQWLGHLCKEKKYMKLLCLYVMTQVQGNLLPIDYVRISTDNILQTINHMVKTRI